MTIGDAQRLVDDWIRGVGGGYFSPLTNMAILAEETGEVARIIARTYGEQIPKHSDLGRNLPEELADVLWVVLCLANQTGVDLEKALLESLKKKSGRDAERFASRRISD